MTKTPDEPEKGLEEVILEQQFLRAASSFEAIILSQIDLTKQLSDRMNYSIRAGMAILAIIAISILILLLTLSAQITHISNVVSDMNSQFTSVSTQMERIDGFMSNMEKRVAMVTDIESQTSIMTEQMELILTDLEPMSVNIGGIKASVSDVRGNIANISRSMDHMNHSVQYMGQDMHRMGQPARSMNKMFPFQ